MQVRACRKPGGSNVTNNLTLSYPLAGFELVGIAAEVGVSGGIRRVMLDANVFAEITVAAPLDNNTVAGS